MLSTSQTHASNRRPGRGRIPSWLVLIALLASLIVPGVALAQPAGQEEVTAVGPLLPDDPPRVADDAPITQQSLAPEASGDYRIDSLVSGYRWPATWPTVTYSFYDTETFNGTYYGSETVSEVSEAVKANVRKIMAWYSSIINVNFVEVTETPSNIGYIRLMLSSSPSYAYAYYPSNTTLFSVAGDVHLNPSYDRLGDTNGFQHPPGYHGYMTLAHEIGHAIGLKHPHDGSPTLPAAEDNTSTTIMTYDFKGNSSGTPMPFDHLALHYIYGARPKWTGNDTYLFTRGADQYNLGGTLYLDPSGSTKQTIWDTGGFNTLDFSAVPYNSGGFRLDMRGIGWLTAMSAYHGGTEPYFDYGVAIPEGVVIRDIVSSSSNDTIYANPDANTFRGYSSSRATGADVIYGASSADTVDLTGYSQTQVTQSQNGNDHVIGLGSNGSITLKDYYLSANNQPAIIFTVVPPSVSIGDATVTEGNSGSTAATFTVSLSQPAAETISVAYATADGTANAGSDYVATSGAVTFAPGVTSQSVTVQVIGDTTVEDNETFYVNLGAVTGNATIADGQGLGTILNDDQPPPATPTNLTATAVSSTQINLTWTDNATNETGYYVERRTGTGTYSRIATLATNTTSYANTGLAAGTTYTYRVQAYNASAVSGYSNEASATTPTPPAIHVGDLDGSAVLAGKKWNATVTITVHNASHGAVAGAVVTGQWAGKGSVTCTTGANGQCSLSKTGLNTTTASINFAVLNITLSGATYNASANHDPDGDSTGTAITIRKP